MDFRYLREDQQKFMPKMFLKTKTRENPFYTAHHWALCSKKDIFSYLFVINPRWGEIQLTDSIKAMIPQEGLCGFRFEGKQFDSGTKEGWLEPNLALHGLTPTSHES